MPAVAAGFAFTTTTLVAEGRQVGEMAALLKASRRWVTKALTRYCQRRCPDGLAEGTRSGCPPLAPALSRDLLTVALEAEPLAFGYAVSG